jgi:2-polyprenyl-3-methyl-5-hydroxy-6-metoxy-1,4-benzoquinol methylase
MKRADSASAGLEGEYKWKHGGEQSHHVYCWKAIEQGLPNGKQLNVLDAGCGPGFITAQLAALGHRVTGIDTSPEGIRLARNTYPNARFETRSVYDDLTGLAPEEGWDLIVSAEVIEHLFAPPRFLENMNRHMRQNGVLLISCPYHGYLKNLAISLVNGWDRHHTVDWACGHIKFFSQRTLERMLIEAGFEPQRFWHAGRLPLMWKSMLCTAVKREGASVLSRSALEPGREIKGENEGYMD